MVNIVKNNYITEKLLIDLNTNQTYVVNLKEDSKNIFDGLYEEAEKYYNIGAYQEAIKTYNEALKINSNIANIYLKIGKSYQMLGEYDKALKVLLKGFLLTTGDKEIKTSLNKSLNEVDKNEIKELIIEISKDNKEGFFNNLF